jgi:hypothetical protein
MKRAQHRKIKRNPAAPPPRDAAPLPFDAATPPRDVTPLPRDAAPLPPAVGRERIVGAAGDRRFVADVHYYRHRARQVAGNGTRPGLIDIGDDNGSTTGCQQFGDGLADAAGPTRDERDFTGKVCFHRSNRLKTRRGREACPTMLSWTAAGRIRLAPELVSPWIVIGHPPTEPKPKNV